MLLLVVGVALAPGATQPLATAASNVAGLEVDLTSLERKGSVLTVKWAVRNTGTAKVRVQFLLTGQQVTTYLVDEENGTKYFALTDSEGSTLASEHVYIGSNTHGIDDEVEAGATKRFWAKFPAPPPEVHEVSVFFTEAEPIEGVAITDK
jgi:hypothetical protein